MTDSIKINLSLRQILPDDRMNINAEICTRSTPWGESKRRYSAPTVQQSPVAKSHTKWVVRCERGSDELEGYLVPTSIDADLNIPNAITGHNVEHGTSVFAAGVASLELLRIWLAECGLPRNQLDLLTTDDITLNGVTLTFLVPCPSKDAAQALMNAINVTSKVLNSGSTSWESSNITVKIPERGFTLGAYIKTELKHCKWADDAPASAMVERTAYIVRIEAKLGLPFLRERNLLKLENWRHAYIDGIYEQIFGETVVKSMRLDGKSLRHKAPREEVYSKLTLTEAHVLRGYIEGRQPRQCKSVVESKNPAKRFSELRLRLLDVAQIDIGIPWPEHVKLRCFELTGQLRYPGDYHPSMEHAPWCFCKDNWPALRETLRVAYEAAVTTAEKQKARDVTAKPVAA
ncbi:hypothetical protein [Janthinobacterium sp. SUN033]|uniref:hypothetical protein n=1 Tax=Janthinobacterium sp. SUN033 TaxID=3002439 RepID=UPI0025AF9BFB|nr:hypothetical protein [Janthinobacterium sp. SUN033]MDN2677664.1 hypothetical protein [Janthinobacterium sp. SUN033]